MRNSFESTLLKSVCSLSLSLSFIVLSVSLKAQAEERFSIQDWKNNFAKAVATNNTAQINKLLDMKSIETKAIPSCIECDVKKKMRQARDLFDKGQYSAAEKIYYDIPKGSDLWLEAVEERGWVHFRNDNFEKALAQTKTLLSPQFASAVNTEAFFLQSVSQLRICDYEGILKTHQTFKEKHRIRIVEVQTLAKTGVNDALKSAIKKAEHFPLKYADFGEDLTKLPLLFYRDLEVQKQLLKLKVAQAGLSVLPDSSHMALNSKIMKMRDDGTNLLQKRIKVLAEDENEQSRKMVQKLNLIEVDAIQRIHTDMKLSKENYREGEFKDVDEDQLVFMDDGHPWIDELDKYDVVAKACNKGIRRKM